MSESLFFSISEILIKNICWKVYQDSDTKKKNRCILNTDQAFAATIEERLFHPPDYITIMFDLEQDETTKYKET